MKCIFLVDEIDGIDVELPHAAAVGKMSPFTVRLVTDAGHMHATSGHPYFVWDFGDGVSRMISSIFLIFFMAAGIWGPVGGFPSA